MKETGGDGERESTGGEGRVGNPAAPMRKRKRNMGTRAGAQRLLGRESMTLAVRTCILQAMVPSWSRRGLFWSVGPAACRPSLFSQAGGFAS